MKYQIYLNKETSELINKIAEREGLKPSTTIKRLLESVYNAAKVASFELEKKIKKGE
jgi:hypothetical protein